MGHKKRSDASNVENEVSAGSIRIECEQALNAGRHGNYSRALKVFKELSLRHVSSPLVHRMRGSYYAKLADLVEKSNAKERHLKDAATSGRKAVALSPNSIDYAQFYASILYKLADDSEKYKKVVVERERGLSIQCPSDPADDNLDLEKKVNIRTSTPEERIRIVQEDLRALLQDAKVAEILFSVNNVETAGSEGRSNNSSTAQRQEESIEVKVAQTSLPNIKSIEQRRMEIQVRVAAARILQKMQEMQMSTSPKPQNEEDEAVKPSSGSHRICEWRNNSNLATEVRPFWDSLTDDKRQELLKVPICDLKAHFISTKNALAVKVLSEAITFAKEKKTWRFWKCCVCDEKFFPFTKLREHLNGHLGFASQKLLPILPKAVDPHWSDMLARAIQIDTWKPVDITATIILMDKQSNQQSSDRTDRNTGATPKAQIWPLTDDSERQQVLERIHFLFRLLLKHKCLTMSHLNKVLEYTMEELQLTIHLSQLMTYGLSRTLQCICFLGTTKLAQIAGFLQVLANSCSLKEDSCELRPIDHNFNGVQTITLKERLSLTDDSSCLLLDDRFLKGELKPSIYDWSTSAPVRKEEDLPDKDALLNWIYSGSTIEEQVSTWMHLMEMRKRKGMESFHMLEKEFKQLQSLCDIKYKHLSYAEQLQAIEGMFKEVKKGDSDLTPQSYMNLLRKRQEEFVKRENDAITFSSGCEVELDAIVNILKEAQALRASVKYEEDDEQKAGDDLDQEDNCVEVAINRLKDQLDREVFISDARIMRSKTSMRQLEQTFASVSLNDFQTVMVALLRSFLQTRLKNLADKEKSDAAREELLAEILSDANKRADPQNRYKRGLSMGKIKKIIEKPRIQSIDDDLKRQEAEVTPKTEVDEDERNLEATLEYHRQIEDSQMLIAQQSKNVDRCLEDIGKKMVGALQVDDEVDEERFQVDRSIPVWQCLEAIEAERDIRIPTAQEEPQKGSLQEDSRAKNKIRPYVFGIGLQNDVGEYNCFLNVIIQSLWHLRKFRDEFLSRSTSVHVHIGDPCVVCALYDVLTGLSIASSDLLREAVDPTSLRVALSNLFSLSNFFQKSQMNDASEVLAVIFDCLHQSFTIGSVVSHCESEESKRIGSWDCTNNTCIAHTLFGMNIYQKMECCNCGLHSRHLKYTSFFRNINASVLRSMKNMHANGSFDELLKLVELEDPLACDTEVGGCGTLNHIRHILSTPPHVFTIDVLLDYQFAQHIFEQVFAYGIEVLGWQTTRESPIDISATLSALATQIDIGVIYKGLGLGSRYCLISVVCYCGLHYYCFAYNPEHDRWIMFDDNTVKVVGFWADVITICARGLLQPQILFFEAIK